MRCEQVLGSIAAVVDGEGGWGVRLSSACHRLSCEQCRRETALLRRMRSIARSLPAAPAPAGLSQRIQAAVADLAPTTGRLPWRPRVARIATMACAVLSVCAAAFMVNAPRRGRSGSAQAEILRALARVNTWHLKGWKLDHGQRIPWEVWAQRSPFFYREQIGPDVVFDDGAWRVTVLAPYERFGRSRPGLVLRMPSKGKEETSRWTYRHMVEMWGDQGRQFYLRDQISEGPVFQYYSVDEGYATEARARYRECLVDPHTWLPKRFEVRAAHDGADQERNYKLSYPIASLAAEYDVPIPAASLAAPEWPTGYARLDAASGARGDGEQNRATAGGFTVQIDPLACDAEGSFLTRVGVRIGGVDVRPTPGGRPMAAMQLSLGSTDWGRPDRHIWSLSDVGEYEPDGRDDAGRPYVEVWWHRLDTLNQGDHGRMILYTPVEPPESWRPASRLITVRVRATLAVYSRLNDTMQGAGDTIIADDVVPVAVSLNPTTAAIDDIVQQLPEDRSGQKAEWRVLDDGLRAAVCQSRARYYNQMAGNAARHQHGALGDLDPSHGWQRWTKAYCEVSTSPHVQFERLHLAENYSCQPDRARAAQMAHTILDDRRFDRLPRWAHEGPMGLDASVDGARKLLAKLGAKH